MLHQQVVAVSRAFERLDAQLAQARETSAAVSSASSAGG
jgi:hypothetical protein